MKVEYVDYLNALQISGETQFEQDWLDSFTCDNLVIDSDHQYCNAGEPTTLKIRSVNSTSLTEETAQEVLRDSLKSYLRLASILDPKWKSEDKVNVVCLTDGCATFVDTDSIEHLKRIIKTIEDEAVSYNFNLGHTDS